MSSCLRPAQYGAYAANVNAEIPAQQTQATDALASGRPHGVIRRERVCSAPISRWFPGPASMRRFGGQVTMATGDEIGHLGGTIGRERALSRPRNA